MITIALLSLMLASSPTENPLEPALAGQQLCTSPDEAQKKCLAIETIRPLAGGGYSDSSVARIALDDRSITVATTITLFIKNGAVCAIPRPEQLRGRQIKVTGKPLTAAQMAGLRKTLAEDGASYLHKEMCMVLEETEEGLVQKTSINGVYDSGLDIFVKWVSPADGYHLVQ
jgi:hypothetical protein